MKGKRYRKEKKENRENRKTIKILLLIFFIIVMIFSGIRIIKWLKENIQNKKALNNMIDCINIDENLESVDKYNIDFEKLKEKNSDIVAWLKVNGTQIEYPVVKTTDNDYYITHSIDKTYNGAGWVFMDYRNRFDGEDKNVVIYAHNRRDGSMFGTLKNILTNDWQSSDENFKVSLISENEKEEYEVFSVYTVEVEDYYITTNFETNDEFQKFINTIKSRSIKDFGIEVSSEDKLLTLSTCSNDNRYRTVLHARKVK